MRLSNSLAVVAGLALAMTPQIHGAEDGDGGNTSSNPYRLIDEVIPAYAVSDRVAVRERSRVADIYHRIHAYVARLESAVLSGKLGSVLTTSTVSDEDLFRAREGERPQLLGTTPLHLDRLAALMQELEQARTGLKHPTQTEYFQLESSERDLNRVLVMLNMGAESGAGGDLAGRFETWLLQSRAAEYRSKAALAYRLMQEQGISFGRAEDMIAEQDLYKGPSTLPPLPGQADVAGAMAELRQAKELYTSSGIRDYTPPKGKQKAEPNRNRQPRAFSLPSSASPKAASAEAGLDRDSNNEAVEAVVEPEVEIETDDIDFDL